MHPLSRALGVALKENGARHCHRLRALLKETLMWS
jgi:hypothetical protein